MPPARLEPDERETYHNDTCKVRYRDLDCKEPGFGGAGQRRFIAQTSGITRTSHRSSTIRTAVWRQLDSALDHGAASRGLEGGRRGSRRSTIREEYNRASRGRCGYTYGRYDHPSVEDFEDSPTHLRASGTSLGNVWELVEALLGAVRASPIAEIGAFADS